MRKRSPDISKAKSLIQASEKEIAYVEKLAPTEEGASTIIRGIYENFRRLGEALLSLQGFDPDNHEEAIGALTKLTVKTTRPINSLDNLRRLRHDINYKGYSPSEADLTDVISIKESCWKPILNEIKNKLT